MNWLKENWFKIGMIIIGVMLIISFYPETNVKIETTRQHSDISLGGANSITCTYPQLVNANYRGGVISHELTDPEVNPFIFTFTRISEGVGNLSWIDSTQSITNTPIVEIFKGDGRVTYMEGTGDAYVAIHTIFLNTGVSTYTKSVDLLGIPFATASIGTCKPY